MKRDIQRHRLLGVLADKRIRFESNTISNDEPLGVSFEELSNKMKCDINELNLIANELYKNKEIVYHNVQKVIGMAMGDSGLSAYANNKYKSRYWKDFWGNMLTISQIIVPILALIVALIAVSITKQQQTRDTEDMQLLRKELNIQQEILNSQTNKISIIENEIKAIQSED